MEYDVGAGRKWESLAKELTARLVAELWDGENFIGRNAYTGEPSGPDKLLSLVPILLGSRLRRKSFINSPKKLTRTLPTARPAFSSSGDCLMLVKGRRERIALKALDRARSDAVECPFRGAALLALAHKVL
jgi:hypothetical protein